MSRNYDFIDGGRAPIKAWTRYVDFEQQAKQQVINLSQMPFVQGIAVLPDVHMGIGCSVGTVAALKGAIIPAIVGVDIGCGMRAIKKRKGLYDATAAISCLHDALLAVAKGILDPKEVADFFWHGDLDRAQFIGGVLSFKEEKPLEEIKA